MKVLVKFRADHKDSKWEVIESSSENRRAFIFERYRQLLFRVVKSTLKVEHPPSKYIFNTRVIVTAAQWMAAHAPTEWYLRVHLATATVEQRIKVAKLLGVFQKPPPFPLSVKYPEAEEQIIPKP